MPQPAGAREGVFRRCLRCGPALRGFLWGQMDGRSAAPRCAGGARRGRAAAAAPSGLRYVLGPLRGALETGDAPRPLLEAGGRGPGLPGSSYLVDSASSHMLVSKIKPCMSKYKHFIL